MFRQKTAPIPTILILVLAFLLSCSEKDDDTPPNSPPTPQEPDTIRVDLNISYQTIAGFGGCNSVFRGASNYPNAADMQKAFGTGEDELGLSIFRVSIPPNAGNWQAIADVALMGRDLNAKVIASPWDAPPELLDPEEDEDVILPSKYGDYVDHLNRYDSFMIAKDVDLYALSIQNEPDIGEWTQWSIRDVLNFTKDYAGDINNRVITAESYNFNRAYYNGLLSDPDACANIDIVGGHIYGNGLGEIPEAEQQGKEIWMTEYLLNEYTDNIAENSWPSLSDEQRWDQSLDMLNTVHESMVCNWNAYIWWYLKRYYSFIGDGLEGSTDGEILKRGYAFSQYSKFVRPGYVRVDVQNPNLPGLKITAYQGDGKVVMVVLNPTATHQKFKTIVNEFDVSSAEAFVTSESYDRRSLQVDIEEGLPVIWAYARSITTIILEI